MIEMNNTMGYTLDIQRGILMKIKTKVFSLGNSNAIRIPSKIMKNLSIKPNDELVMEIVDDEIRIRKEITTIEQLFENYHEDYRFEEMFPDCVGGEEI